MVRLDLAAMFRQIPASRGDTFMVVTARLPSGRPSRAVTWEQSASGQVGCPTIWGGGLEGPVIEQALDRVTVKANLQVLWADLNRVIVRMLLAACAPERGIPRNSPRDEIYHELSDDLWRQGHQPAALVVPWEWSTDNREPDWLTTATQHGFEVVFRSPDLDPGTLIGVAGPDMLGSIVQTGTHQGVVITDTRAVVVRTLPPVTIWDRLMQPETLVGSD